MAMSVAKKDKPTMSVTALINWARPLPPAQQQQPMTPTSPGNMLQPMATLSAIPTVDCSLDIQCKYQILLLATENSSRSRKIFRCILCVHDTLCTKFYFKLYSYEGQFLFL